MNEKNLKLGISRFFSGLFKNLGKLIFANILFSIPLLAFSGLFYWLNSLTNANVMFILFLPIIFVFPFFSGLTLITRNIVREDKSVPVFQTFIKGIKENFLYFLVHGIVLYVCVFLCYSSIFMYWNMAQSNGIFFVPFGIAVLIAITLLFMFYNIPVMTVTFELSLKNIYKNSLLMSFGEIKNNFFSTLGLFLLFIFCVSILIASPSAMVLLIIVGILSVLLIPSIASYIINFYVYDDMENLFVNKSNRSEKIKKQIENQKNGVDKNTNVKLDFSSLDLDPKKDGEEFLFFNGKMIKRKTIIEMKRKQDMEDEQEN